jgi:hypothetical protein
MSKQEWWECFGSLFQEPPYMSRLLNEQPQEESDVWPDAEVTNGIFLIEIKNHGDDPSDAFIHVLGTSQEAVVRGFIRAKETLVKVCSDWYEGDKEAEVTSDAN